MGDLLGSKGTIYERELKGILSGDDKIISKFKKSLGEDFKWYESSKTRPFMVLRAAGSLGVDLVAIRNDYSFPIEVKSSSSKTIIFTHSRSHAQEQAEKFLKECEEAKILGLYAFRLKRYRGDPWRVFALPVNELSGRIKLIYELLPKIPLTKEGNFILRWEEGMPLAKFLSYLNQKE